MGGVDSIIRQSQPLAAGGPRALRCCWEGREAAHCAPVGPPGNGWGSPPDLDAAAAAGHSLPRYTRGWGGNVVELPALSMWWRVGPWPTGRLADWPTGRLADRPTGRLAKWETAGSIVPAQPPEVGTTRRGAGH